MHLSKKIKFLPLVFFLCTSQIQAQNFTASSKDAENAISEQSLLYDIEFLTDSICNGRATGTRGASEAAAYIAARFRQEGLMPINDNYFQNFKTVNGLAGHNVVGVLKSNPYKGSDKYIIVAAHFDNLGELDGRIYPGADSNASGISAMLGLAGMFKFMREGGRNYNQHIIFVALDGKQSSMAGAEELWRRINSGTMCSPVTGNIIRRQNITMFVNLDILGGTEAPLHEGRPDYLMMLGGRQQNTLLATTNKNYNINLDIAFDYYGSKGFTDMFLNKVSDQKVFLQHGIYSVLFTSGITMKTNRYEDRPEYIDMTVLKKRTWLIFHWIERVIQIL